MSHIIENWLLAKILGWSGNDLADFLDEFPLEEYKEKRTCPHYDDMKHYCNIHSCDVCGSKIKE